MAAYDESRRIRLHAFGRGADLTVPASLPIGELLPAMLELAGGEHTGGDVTVSRPGGEPLDTAKSLSQCGVSDGDLLVLASPGCRPPGPHFDVGTGVAAAGTPSAAVPAPGMRRMSAGLPAGWAGAVAVALLAWPVFDQRLPRRVWLCAAAALASLVAAVLIRRRGDRVAVMVLGSGATVFGAVAGLLAVPGPPGMPSFLLAASGCALAALASWRLTGCGTRVFVPLSGIATGAAVPALGAVAGWWPVPAVGPLLAATGLAALTGAARLAVLSAHLTAGGPFDGSLDEQASRAREHVPVVVTTTAGAAALGAVLTAVTGPARLSSAGLIAAVGAVLILRERTLGCRCATTLRGSAAIAGTALVGVLAVNGPAQPWLCLALLTSAVAAIWVGSGPATPSTVVPRRVLGVLDVVATAAVVPAACAAAGLFGAVRGTSPA